MRSSFAEASLPPLFIGEVARWIRAKPGAAGTEGFPSFLRKEGMLPPALRATPLINVGGKSQTFRHRKNAPCFSARGVLQFNQRTYSMTTRRFGSVPVEWVVMLSMSCREAWITWRS